MGKVKVFVKNFMGAIGTLWILSLIIFHFSPETERLTREWWLYIYSILPLLFAIVTALAHPKPVDLRLEFKEVRKEKANDTNFRLFFDIYNDGDLPAKDWMIKLELPGGITADETGRGWITENIEAGRRYGVVSQTGDDSLIQRKSKFNPTIFGLYIPEDKKGEEIVLGYQIITSGMRPKKGKLIFNLTG